MSTSPTKTSSPEHSGHTGSLVQAITHVIHKHFLLILIAAYFLSATLPLAGLWLRKVQLGHIQWFDGSSVNISLSLVMLSLLLFNAGLGIKLEELKGLLRRPVVLTCGFIANTLVPVALVLVLLGALNYWHSNEELQLLLVGLAMIVAMPIAGSSTAWSQNANGNLSLSLGLVFLSTLLSPLTTPVVLHLFSFITNGDYSEDLHEMASQGTNAFMTLTVVLPSFAGIATHFLLGEKRVSALKPYLKLTNFAFILLLNYSNAASSLPEAVRHPDPDFLALTFGITILLCSAAFGSGWLIARWLKTDESEKAALMFGLGMNNNGTGLVLAAAALADHTGVLLPMIFYTLVQQVIAAIVDRRFFKKQLLADGAA